MRIGDEGREPPMRLPEPSDRAAEHQAPIDDHGMEHRAPDRPSEVVLNEVFGPEEIVTGAGLPILGLGLDGPGCYLAVRRAFGPAGCGVDAVKLAELAQLGPEHAIILRKTARIVSLHIDDLAVLNAHATSPD